MNYYEITPISVYVFHPTNLPCFLWHLFIPVLAGLGIMPHVCSTHSHSLSRTVANLPTNRSSMDKFRRTDNLSVFLYCLQYSQSFSTCPRTGPTWIYAALIAINAQNNSASHVSSIELSWLCCSAHHGTFSAYNIRLH